MTESTPQHGSGGSVVDRIVRSLAGGRVVPPEAPVPADDLLARMWLNAVPSLNFFLMLGLASVIAVLGLIADSAPTIIGAMIIAPLMAPIVSVAFGIACLNRHLVAVSLVTIFAGMLLVVAIAWFGVWVFGVRIAGTEILARTAPSMLDLGVALAAGCAGAFAQTRRSIAGSIAGVAIAVALVPPLAVTGIGLSLGGKATTETGTTVSEFGVLAGGADIASGSFLLFLTNLLGIIVVAALVFTSQRYGNWRKALVAIAVVVVTSFLLVPYLYETLREIYVKNRVVRLYVKNSAMITGSRSTAGLRRLEDVSVAYRDDVLLVSIDMFATRDHLADAQRSIDIFQTLLANDLDEPVVVDVNVVLIDFVEFRSATGEPVE